MNPGNLKKIKYNQPNKNPLELGGISCTDFDISKEKIPSLKLLKFNHFLMHAGRVVLCCVSPIFHLAVKWMKSWLIARRPKYLNLRSNKKQKIYTVKSRVEAQLV
jgi:hypothetical protein